MPQKRVVLKNCGVIDPEDIDSYIANDGSSALNKALQEMTPAEVIQEIKDSGLRGRGGAGFPTGLKWELAGQAQGDEKYVVCNADEGEVGTFKDRYALEGDPFTVIEAVAIASYAIGAKEAFIYLRAEYHHLFDALEMKRLGVRVARHDETTLTVFEINVVWNISHERPEQPAIYRQGFILLLELGVFFF